MRRQRRASNRTAPPKPITAKRPTIDLAGLELAYGWTAYDKVTGLEMATDWYATNAVKLLFGKPLAEDQQRTYNRAVKAASLGIGGGTTGPEREHALNTAIRLYESIWTDTTRQAAITHSANAEQVKTVVDNFNAVFNTLHVSYLPATIEEREFDEQGTDTGSEFTVKVPFTELLATVGKSPLEAALAEVPAVTQMISVTTRLEPDAETGRFAKVAELDGAKFMTNLPLVLKAVYAWASNTDAKLVKPVGKATKTGIIAGSATRTYNPNAAPPTKFNPNGIIRILVSATRYKFGTNRRGSFDLLHDGITVAEYRRVQSAAFPKSGGELKFFLDDKAVEIV